jgi:hypothetical protein
MTIPPSLPFHVSRAYGMTGSAPLRPATPAVPPTALQPARNAINQLVAGTVARPPEFSASFAAGATAPPALQLYTRAADKVEAATAVQIGRMFDFSG